MYTTDIDKDTGLPILPNGQIWRVEEDSIWYDLGVRLFNGYSVCIVEIGGNIYYTHKWLSFLPNYPKQVVEDKILRQRKIMDPDTGFRADDLTEDLIRRNALKLLEEVAEIEQTKSLIGDYPPNKLS